MTPLIFDIKRSSVTDGPGIRTVVFFKGCNLDCFWCHNPEGKMPFAETAYFKEKCIGCGACKKEFADCPAGAKKQYGREYTADELFDIIKKDRAYYKATGGGVTFSGGECMLYPDYLAQIAALCKEAGISVAVDTAGCVPFESFEKVLPYTDIFLYDIKAADPDIHKAGTGKDNTLILENLERLIKADAKVTIRTPVIPDYNDGAELQRITEYCKSRNLTHELLEYHTLGQSKKEALQPHTDVNFKL